MARILVADTDKSIRDLVRLRLSAWGHEVHSFADGFSALHAWRDGDFGLTLLDSALPRMSGLDVLSAIRAADREKHAPVVLLCSLQRDADAASGYRLGADEVVFKPFKLGFVSTFANLLPVEAVGAERAALAV